MRKGEIWWASLPAPRGSEPGYRRPVIVVQSDAFTRSNISTVIVAVISSNLRLSAAPGNILLKRKDSRLSRDSVINISQLITLDKSYLTEKVSKLRSDLRTTLDDGLRLVLSL
ncbi:MAG: type II toxin-antitoxin system PemK/MazF family toxin [Candidatus Krumholzibacteria bacterium]|nr:type II toxin-antitoxin system PemK/MazF family toxin [Candidatus Krumholzibacteria bacterium]